MATVPITRAARADAAQALYERYYPNVYRYALSQLRSPQDAEDAAQNTFLRAFAALQKGVVPENEVAWLFKIAHNVCASSKLAWLRRRRVEAPRDLDLLPVQPATPESRRDELAGLEDALAAMPPRLREAFLLREWQGLSYAEIAERLDTSRSAVETLIFRARKLLAQQLEQPVRRVREALGLGPLLNLFRGLLNGTPAVVKAAGAVAILAGAGVAAQPLVTPKHSTPPAATYELPIAPAIAQTTQPSSRPAARRPVQRQAGATKRTSPSATTAAPEPRVPLAPGAPPIQSSTPAPAAPASAPSSSPSTPSPGSTVPTVAVPQVPPLETPPVPSVTTPALPVTTPGLPPTPPLESPAVPPVTIPDLPSVPTVPTVPLPGSLP
jgi:RNA polymerase sigma-70 factor (ECF subfamily)